MESKMPVSEKIKFADHNLHGVQVTPMPKAHYGVIAFLRINKSAVVHVNCGQVIFETWGLPDYCIGYAEGSNCFAGPGRIAPLFQTAEAEEPSMFDAAAMYAEWLDGQRKDAYKSTCDWAKWRIA